MRIAITSSDGRAIDEHFGTTPWFYIWEVLADSAECVGRVAPPSLGEGTEDKTEARAQAVRDCRIVCTMQIGGPAAAKLVRHHIHPMKTNEPVKVSEMIARLQGVLRGNPPPWLRRALDREEEEVAEKNGNEGRI